MTKSSVAGLAILTVSLLWGSVAEAQKQREQRPSIIDQMRARRGTDTTPGAVADDVGEITGDERFLRDARDASDFVGADSREGGFVGGQSAADGEIRSAIENAGDLVREAVDPAINRIRSLPQLQTGMYAPRLRLGFTPTTLPAPTMEAALVQRLSTSSAIRTTEPIAVSMAGRTATLRGTVVSAHEKRLAGLMLLFEPGISKVENELAVATPESSSPVEPQSKPAPVELPAPAPQKERLPDQS
jgi:uncharacterized protein YjbJ (UPF0337 family)